MRLDTYYFDEESKMRSAKNDSYDPVDISRIPPVIHHNFNGIASFDAQKMASENKIYYFESNFSEDDLNSPVRIFDGRKLLPLDILKLLFLNGFSCTASEIRESLYSLSLAVFYDNTAKLEFSDMIHPSGPCSEIYIISDGRDGYSYLVEFNHHCLTVDDEEVFECELVFKSNDVVYVDFTDDRGIKRLAQCLEYVTNL